MNDILHLPHPVFSFKENTIREHLVYLGYELNTLNPAS